MLVGSVRVRYNRFDAIVLLILLLTTMACSGVVSSMMSTAHLVGESTAQADATSLGKIIAAALAGCPRWARGTAHALCRAGVLGELVNSFFYPLGGYEVAGDREEREWLGQLGRTRAKRLVLPRQPGLSC